VTAPLPPAGNWVRFARLASDWNAGMIEYWNNGALDGRNGRNWVRFAHFALRGPSRSSKLGSFRIFRASGPCPNRPKLGSFRTIATDWNGGILECWRVAATGRARIGFVLHNRPGPGGEPQAFLNPQSTIRNRRIGFVLHHRPSGSRRIRELALFDTEKRDSCGGRLSPPSLASLGSNTLTLTSVVSVPSVVHSQELGEVSFVRPNISSRPPPRAALPNSYRRLSRPVCCAKTKNPAEILCHDGRR